MPSIHENDEATRLANSVSATPLTANADSNHKQLATGTLLKNRFELLEEIGRGGMGTVYKALDKRDIEAEHTSFLAIKVLNDELQADNALLKALHSEAKKSQELAHPNIVTVYDFDRENNHIFMTMEYMDGVSLDQVIRGNPDGLPLHEALQIIDQLGAALAYAHSRHIVHSDFKPSNVFVSRDKRVKVIDFGIARVVKSERREKFDAGILRGLTPAYASLEMFQDQEPAPKDDIYALACVAYELLTGHHPYGRQRADTAKRQALEAKKPGKLNQRQWAALRSGLQLDRTQRIADVTDFYQGLHAKKTSPLYSLVTVSLAMIIMALILLREPLNSYWRSHFDQPPTMQQGSLPTADRKPLLPDPAVFSAPQYACLRQKRALMIVHVEMQESTAANPRLSLDKPGFYARIYQAVKPYGLKFIEAAPSVSEEYAAADTLYSDLRRRFGLDYLLNVTLSAREIPITAVQTTLKTIKSQVTLELVDFTNEQIVNEATAEFKQPGVDMLDILDTNLQKNIDALSAELFTDLCS